MRRLLLAVTAVVSLGGTAEALTIRDIIELTRAGISEEVLLALIEVDRGVYAIDTATLKQLKAAGVGERVMVALVRSGREALPETSAPVLEAQDAQPPVPQVVVIDHHDPPVERIREVPVAVPVYIPVTVGRRHHAGVTGSFDASNFIPFQSGPPAGRDLQPRKTEPVYWGWGGKRRPDAWQPSPSEGHLKPPDRKK